MQPARHIALPPLEQLVSIAFRLSTTWRQGGVGTWPLSRLASSKGGVGKSTLSILIGAELAGYGYRVSVLDCDINQHASAFGEKCSIERFRVVPDINDHNFLPALREAEARSDVVIVDLAGETSRLNLKALHRSSFVLIPCQASLPDVRDAVKTAAQVDEAQELARVTIARSLIWTRVLPGFESTTAQACPQDGGGEGARHLPVQPDGTGGLPDDPPDRQDAAPDRPSIIGNRERRRDHQRTSGTSGHAGEGGMNELPELDIEPRRPNLKAIRQTVSDDAVERHARKLGADWLGDTKPPLASLRVEIPKYVDKLLAMAAAERGVTKQFLILEALSKTGYPVQKEDLIEDKRRVKR